MIAGTSGAISAAFAQMQQRQAERSAELAEQRARSLQTETRQAKAEAERAQEQARTLEVETDQAVSEAGRARSGVLATETLQELDTRLDALRTSINTAFPPAGEPPGASPARPVLNAQGEVTGTVINVSA